ncbi:MAG: hypothetical protein N2712_06980 [Brevinematales bacterium]|nr:hypothetical protein [Brevinematales bacterium]
MQFAKSDKGKGKGLIRRDDQGDYWWELRYCTYYDEFEKEKIIWQEMSELPSFCLDKDKFYVNQTAYMMTGNRLKVILSVLNSKISWWYIQHIAYSLSKNAYRWIKQYVELIPISKLILSKDDKIIKLQQLVDQISKLKSQNPLKGTSEYEEEIDELVYQLYELTRDEIKIVEEK